MKKFLSITLIIFCVLRIDLFCQTEKEISSTMKRVIVYKEGAQIESEAIFSLQPGVSILKITGLSPFIQDESIRVNGDGSFMILNVQHQNDFINELEKSRQVELVNNKIAEFQFKIEDEETWININNEKLKFLDSNKEITGKEQALNPETFKSLNTIYGENIESLNLQILKKKRLIQEYKKELNKLNNQLGTLNSKPDLPSGTIIITIISKLNKNASLNVFYRVGNASWYPSYDIRFHGINKPLAITYKANIRQNTGIDWNDVKLVFSTAKTSVSAQIPDYTPFYLQFYYPDISLALQGRVSGVEISNNSGVPGSQSELRIRGANTIQSENEPLYVVDGVPQSNLTLDPNEIEKIEVLKDASSTAIYGSRGSNGVILVTTKQNNEKSSIPFTITSKRETSNEYVVDVSQSVLSNDKISTISFKETELNASFEYKSLPRFSENVFLIAKIPDWYKAEFIQGEAQLYLENSFVGKSIINTEQYEDTMEISFGIDNNISIKRERVKEYLENQVIGPNRKETVGFRISVRNNKSYPVITEVIDQIPVSTTKDIQVEVIDIAGGLLEEETGKVTWDIKLNANESKEIIIKYSVKFPKDKKVIIE